MLFGGKKFDFVPHDLRHMLPFDPAALLPNEASSYERLPQWEKLADLKQERRQFEYGRMVTRVRTPAWLPPDRKSVHKWLKNERGVSPAKVNLALVM